MKKLFTQPTQHAQHVQPDHCAQTAADEVAIAAQLLVPLQLVAVASGGNSGDGNAIASALEKPFQSSLVDALIDQLRKARVKRARPH